MGPESSGPEHAPPTAEPAADAPGLAQAGAGPILSSAMTVAQASGGVQLAGGLGAQRHVLGRMAATHGNQFVAAVAQQVARQKVFEAPEIDKATMGLTAEQHIEVDTWITIVHRARERMDERDFIAAHKEINALDARGRAFKGKYVQHETITGPALAQLGAADVATNETLVQVGALAGKRRDNLRETYQFLFAAEVGIGKVADGSDKLSDAEKGFLRSFQGQLTRVTKSIETFETPTPVLQGVMEKTLPMIDHLTGLAEKAPELHAAAEALRNANLILQVIVHPAEGLASARSLINEIESALRRALSLPIWQPGQPTRIANPPGPGPKTTLRPD